MRVNTRSLGKSAFLALTAAVIVLGGVTFAATAASPSAASGIAALARTPTCATSTLVVWLDTMGNGTAGGTYYNLEFTNLSVRACTLVGYPGVSAVSLGGSQLGNAASRDSTHAPTVITLAGNTSANQAGTTATVVLKITDVGVYASSACGPVTAAGLRVYPPGQTASKVVPFPFRACSRTGPIYLHVEAVEKGIVSTG